MRNLTRLVLIIALIIISFALIANPEPTETQKFYTKKELKLAYWKYKYGNNPGNKFDLNIDPMSKVNPVLTSGLKLPEIKKLRYNVYYQDGNYIIPRFYMNKERSFYFFRTFF